VFEQVLGVGAYGVVYKARDLTRSAPTYYGQSNLPPLPANRTAWRVSSPLLLASYHTDIHLSCRPLHAQLSSA
jgi:hypothetical protein